MAPAASAHDVDETTPRHILQLQTLQWQTTELSGQLIIVTGGAKGTVVNTAAIYGLMAVLGSFNYNAARAAVVMMSSSGARELAPHGMRAVGIAPGVITTPILGSDSAMKPALSKVHMWAYPTVLHTSVRMLGPSREGASRTQRASGSRWSNADAADCTTLR